MRNIWKLLLVAIAGLALAGAAVGIVAAQTDGPTPTPSATEEESDTPTATEEGQDTPTEEADATPTAEADATPSDDNSDSSTDEKATRRDAALDTLAENLGISREELDAALRQTGLDLVDQALADGRITEDEAAAIRERIESGEFPFFFGGPGFHHRGFAFCPGASLEEIADFLGVDRDVIVEGLQNDESLAQIAEANGSSRDALIEFIMGKIEERVNQAVENGRITQDQADEILANSGERVNDLVDREGLPDRGPRPGFGPRGGPGFLPPSGEEDVTPETSGLVF
jgi:hypothetical protein